MIDFKTEIKDQSIHFGVAFISIAAAILTGPVGGFISGSIHGFVREISEVGGSRVTSEDIPRIKEHFSTWNPWVDILFWGFGGYTAGWLPSFV